MYSGETLKVDPAKQGLHWVSELILEADVQTQSGGELLLDLVRGGKHFTCTIALKTGEAKLAAANLADYAPKASTVVIAPGTHHISFGNVDDQLLLWVDGKSIAFDGGTTYDAEEIYGERSNILPQTGDTDLGDLAPAGIGARDAKLTVTRLQVWRDLYYIADSWERNGMDAVVTDFRHPFDPALLNIPTTPSKWDRLRERKAVEFKTNDEQLFVMGDNSAESSDARLWFNSGDPRGNHPGGAYLDRRLLIGKALCVYWPHSWNTIPGTPIPFPLFPNVMDMRLVK
jgi:signal peptidase I